MSVDLVYFRREEFRAYDTLDEQMLRALDALRARFASRLRILDDWRDPDVQKRLYRSGESGTEFSYHCLGKAVDVEPLDEPWRIMELYAMAQDLPAFGLGGIGLYADPGAGSPVFIHMDVGRGELDPRPARWVRVDGQYQRPSPVNLAIVAQVAAELGGASATGAPSSKAAAVVLLLAAATYLYLGDS